MRQLSKRTQYCLRALYALARDYGQGPTLIAQLATEEAIPKKFLEQILLSLKSTGLVESKKGKGGVIVRWSGRLMRSPSGPCDSHGGRPARAPSPCASETRFQANATSAWTFETVAALRIVMREVRDAIAVNTGF